MKAMRAIMMVLIAGLGLLVARPVAAQVKLESKETPQEQPMRVVPPPLRYETTRPQDTDYYPRGTKVQHDPAFIEPLSSKYENASGSGRVGVSGWTAPNQPVGGAAGLASEVNGWFALGFSITWGGPPAPPAHKPVPAPR
jgi:hypothetical protein